jgi:hypothetical protein
MENGGSHSIEFLQTKWEVYKVGHSLALKLKPHSVGKKVIKQYQILITSAVMYWYDTFSTTCAL